MAAKSYEGHDDIDRADIPHVSLTISYCQPEAFMSLSQPNSNG